MGPVGQFEHIQFAMYHWLDVDRILNLEVSRWYSFDWVVMVNQPTWGVENQPNEQHPIIFLRPDQPWLIWWQAQEVIHFPVGVIERWESTLDVLLVVPSKYMSLCRVIAANTSATKNRLVYNLDALPVRGPLCFLCDFLFDHLDCVREQIPNAHRWFM